MLTLAIPTSRLARTCAGWIVRTTGIALVVVVPFTVPTPVLCPGGMRATARNQAYEIAKAFELYELQHGRYPTRSEGLTMLVAPPEGRPIMAELPLDPWGDAYLYVVPGEKNPTFDVRSAGEDRRFGTEDDVGNWQDEG